METATDNDLLVKFQAVSQGPDRELLQKFLDILYERLEEEYDSEPLSSEELGMITNEKKKLLKRGNSSKSARITFWRNSGNHFYLKDNLNLSVSARSLKSEG
jgi:hypothetical protein